MAYYTDLFTVETYRAFLSSDKTVSGFRESQRTMAKKLKRGDKMLAYLTGLSRWAGVLEVVGGPYEDRAPIFYSVDDPFIIRFKVNARLPFRSNMPSRSKTPGFSTTCPSHAANASSIGSARSAGVSST